MSDTKPRIYLAGKMMTHSTDKKISGWRADCVGNGNLDDVSDENLFNPHYTVECSDFIVTGPFFAPVGHNKFCVTLNPNSHGTNLSWPTTIKNLPRDVFNLSLRRIEMADFVFAYINEVDCYGTLIELGHAHAIGRPIFMCLGPELTINQQRDLWFALNTAVIVYRASIGIEVDQALQFALKHWSNAQKAMRLGLQPTAYRKAWPQT